MKSPSMQESLHSHTSESDLNPIVRINQQNRVVEGRKEDCWSLKRGNNELAGYVFDSELLHEGSD
jgi:hypothetical protein